MSKDRKNDLQSRDIFFETEISTEGQKHQLQCSNIIYEEPPKYYLHGGNIIEGEEPSSVNRNMTCMTKTRQQTGTSPREEINPFRETSKERTIFDAV